MSEISADSRGLNASQAAQPPAGVVGPALGNLALRIDGNSFFRAGLFLLAAAVAGVVYGQAPLYTSNQNQYFLHGLARAGLGLLKDDWLARTVDPTPVFSFLVAVTYRYLHAYLFYVYFTLMVGAYFYSLAGITSHGLSIRTSGARLLAYLALLAGMHSALLGNLSLELLGLDLRMVLTDGVAGQYILGSILQPSLFGVFLMVSISLFLRGKSLLAAVSAVLAATVHPTYLLAAGVLVFSYMVVTFKESRSAREAGLIGLVGLALVLPILAYVSFEFRPTSLHTSGVAQYVLMNVRLPHHLLIHRWLGVTASLQMIIVVAGLYVARRSRRLFPVLLLSTVTAATLTVVQALSGSASLALLFPWRFSTYLVPISSSLLAAWLVSQAWDRFVLQGARVERMLVWGSCVLILALVLAGGLYMKRDVVERERDASVSMMDFVRQAKAAGDIYFIPADLERFRLYTAAPVFIDRKSIPYRDVDLVEWYQRYLVATEFYRLNDPALVCDALARVSARYSFTHVVLRGEQADGNCPYTTRLYQDSEYGVYRVTLP